MSPKEQYELEIEILQAAIDAPIAQREQIIVVRCEGNAQLEKRVRQLLEAHSDSAPIWRATPADFLETVAGQMLCGRFELLKRLGEGGMGIVWSAKDHKLGDLVAVKMILPEVAMQPEAIARFKHELQLARRIGHPNVCRMYELFEDEAAGINRWFLTMELVEGTTLSQSLRAGEQLTDAERNDILRGILGGLAAAHQLGIVHRDLKPGNVMLSDNGQGQRRAVITDFGLAKQLATDAGRSATIAGTPAFMAPEQLAGKAATPATDIYAFGLTAVALLTGETKPSLERVPPDWKLLAERSTPHMARMLRRCMEEKPENRFANGSVALAQWDSPDASWRSLQVPQWLRRRWLAAAVAILAVAAGTWTWRRVKGAAAPPEAQIWYRDGLQSLAEGASIRARGEFEKALEIAPSFAAAMAGKAEALLELEMTGQARDAMLHASDAAPDRSRLPADEHAYVEGINRLVVGDCAPALESLKAMSEQASGANKPLALLVRTRAAIRCNQAAEASDTLAEAAPLDTRNAAIPMLKAVLAARRRDYAAAEELLNAADKLYRVRDQREGTGQVLLYRATFLEEQNRLDEAAQTLDNALGIAQTSPNALLKVRVLLEKGLVARLRGDMNLAAQFTADAAQLASRENLDTVLLQALFAAGNIHLKRFQVDLAEPQFLRALEIAERFRNQEAVARAQLSLGSVYVNTGQPGKAIPLIESALPFYQRSGLVRNVASGNLLLGQAYIINTDFQEARKLLSSQLEFVQKVKDVEREAVIRETLATPQAELGDLLQALENYQKALEIHRGAGKKRNAVYSLLNVSDLQSRLGRTAAAAASWQEALRMTSEIEREPADLHQRLMIVQAVNAIRAGDLRVAAAAGTDAARGKLSQSITRRVHAESALCIASGVTHCEGVLKLVESSAPEVKMDAQLAVAQGYLRAKLHRRADDLAALACKQLLNSRSPEGAWIALAIRVKATQALGKPTLEFSQEASRQLENFRLRVSGQDFDQWSQRADIRELH